MPNDFPMLFILLILIISISACASVNTNKHKDDWFGKDKAQHFSVSAVIAAGTSITQTNRGKSDCDAATAGITVSIGIGAGKEYYDKYARKKYWSWKDMFWNFIGATVGSLAATGCH